MSAAIAATEAGGIIQQIYDQLGEASANELVLEQSWMRLGRLLAVCKSGEHWRAVAESFEKFMEQLQVRYNRGRTQLWSYYTVAEKLEPIIPANHLEEIGISKALELRKALRKSGGKPIPEEIIAAARKQETTIKELRARLAQAFNLAPDDKGTWFDLDGFFLTPEERQEFVAAVKMTLALLNVKKEVPDHIKRKEVFLAWMREFAGTHAADVNGPSVANQPPKLLGVGQ